jgi:hypothetical protein
MVFLLCHSGFEFGDLFVFGGEFVAQGRDDAGVAASRDRVGGGMFAVLIDDRDEVGMFVDGLALHAGACGDGRDVDGGVGFSQLAYGLLDGPRLSLATASRWRARPCSALSDGGAKGIRTPDAHTARSAQVP